MPPNGAMASMASAGFMNADFLLGAFTKMMGVISF